MALWPFNIKLPVSARGGAKVALGLYYKTFFPSIELACAVRQPGPCVRALCDSDAVFQRSHLKLHTSHCTLHSSHCALTLHSPHFVSSHLSYSHLISSHMSSIYVLNYFHFIRALLNLSHLIEALLNSSQLFFMSEGFCRQREVSCTQKPEKPLHTAHEKFLHTARFYTEKFLHTEAFTHSKLLHTASFYTQQAFNTEKLFHTASFYPEKLLHRVALTHRKL